LLAEHLFRASYFDSLTLTGRQHINKRSGANFNCFSYYCEQQKALAVCSAEDFGFVASMSAAFVRRLLKIAVRIGDALIDLTEEGPDGSIRILEGHSSNISPPEWPDSDLELYALLWGSAEVSETEAETYPFRLFFFA
jgi:hypothetical protein